MNLHPQNSKAAMLPNADRQHALHRGEPTARLKAHQCALLRFARERLDRAPEGPAKEHWKAQWLMQNGTVRAPWKMPDLIRAATVVEFHRRPEIFLRVGSVARGAVK